MISIRLRRLSRRLSCVMGLPRDVRPGMQGFIPLSFNASVNQSALAGSLEPVALTGSIAPVGKHPLCIWQAAQKGSGTGVVADLASRHEEADRATLGIGDGVQLRIHATLGSAD
jgi:hypothetical protein